jgi:RNA polymerase sigma-70 factor (ECF subfamily)
LAIEADPLEAHAIARVQQGDAGAYDYLVSKYLRRVVSIAWNIVRNRDDAEDLGQEAFVRAFQNIGRFRAGEPFGPWVYRIATNLALDVVKHRTKFRHEEVGDDTRVSRDDDAALQAETNELTRRIDAALESLPQMQRIVARLHLIEQFEHAEIAAMTSLNEGTIRAHLSLAKKKLRERLADLYDE